MGVGEELGFFFDTLFFESTRSIKGSHFHLLFYYKLKKTKQTKNKKHVMCNGKLSEWGTWSESDYNLSSLGALTSSWSDNCIVHLRLWYGMFIYMPVCMYSSVFMLRSYLMASVKHIPSGITGRGQSAPQRLSTEKFLVTNRRNEARKRR